MAKGYYHPWKSGGSHGPHIHGGVHHGWVRRGRRWQGLYGGAPFGGIAPDPQVSWAQGCLAQSVDPSVPQDGILGPQTRQAIQSFQAQQQLRSSGVLDPDTVSALQAACSGQQGPQPPAAAQPPPPPPPQGPPPPSGPHSHGPHPPQSEFEAEFPFDLHPRERFDQRDRWRRDRDRDRRWGWLSQDNREQEANEVRVERPLIRPRLEFRRFGDRRDWLSGVPVDRSRVRWAQSCLAQVLGSWVLQDGEMGENTRSAIRMFQNQQQLTQTGVLDENTLGALRAACGN
jgi:peptidoglycan hydrolase-like protein with peptidoglycan-binding domain